MIYTFGFPCRFLFYFYDEKHIVVSTINIAFLCRVMFTVMFSKITLLHKRSKACVV